MLEEIFLMELATLCYNPPNHTRLSASCHLSIFLLSTPRPLQIAKGIAVSSRNWARVRGPGLKSAEKSFCLSTRFALGLASRSSGIHTPVVGDANNAGEFKRRRDTPRREENPRRTCISRVFPDTFHRLRDSKSRRENTGRQSESFSLPIPDDFSVCDVARVRA